MNFLVPEEKAVFLRENSNNMYSVGSFYISKIIAGNSESSLKFLTKCRFSFTNNKYNFVRYNQLLDGWI